MIGIPVVVGILCQGAFDIGLKRLPISKAVKYGEEHWEIEHAPFLVVSDPT
ncbi:hypothetical protein D3C71_1219370 [compost metagenome]